MTTNTTFLRSETSVDKLDSFSSHLSFVVNELLKLVVAPSIQDGVKPLSLFTLPLDVQLLQHDNVKGHGDYLFADAVINVSNETVFPSAQRLNESLRRLCAFALKTFSQMVILAFDIPKSLGIKKRIVGTDRDVLAPSVYPEYSGPSSLLRLSGLDKDCENPCLARRFVLKLTRSLNVFKINPISIFRLDCWNLKPTLLRGKFHELLRDTARIPIVSDGRESTTFWLLSLKRTFGLRLYGFEDLSRLASC